MEYPERQGNDGTDHGTELQADDGQYTKPLRLCKHCTKVFVVSRPRNQFCSPECKNRYNVYKSRSKNRDKDGKGNA